LSPSEIEIELKNLEIQSKAIKDEIFKISWYMRGGVNSIDLFHVYGYEDRQIMWSLIKENIETTKNTKMPLI
jgi:hypothetical protein